MNRKEVFAKLSDFENKYPVSDWKFNDIQIWPIIRIRILYKYYGKVGNKPTKEKKVHFLEAVRNKLKAVESLFKGGIIYYKLKQEIAKGIDHLFISYVVHRQLIGDKFYNKFLDIFIEKATINGLKPVVVEFKSQEKAYQKNISFPDVNFPGDDLIGFYAKFLKKPKDFQSSLPRYEEFLHELRVVFGENVIKNITPAKLLVTAGYLETTAALFTNLFETNKPKMVFCVSFQSVLSQGALLAAHRAGIPTVDIQHGTQGAINEAYGTWNKIPENGFNLLPKVFWNWDKGSAQNIISWSYLSDFHYSIIGGNPWVLFWKKKKFEKEFNVSDLKKQISNRKVVLYSLQPSFEPLPSLISNLIERTKDDFVWLLRMHPRQIERKEDLLERLSAINTNNNINLLDATNLPLFLLLGFTDFHLTVYSTVATEAAAYQIPTIFINTLAEQYFKDILEPEYAYYNVVDEEEIIRILRQGNGKANLENQIDFSLFEKAYKQLLSDNGNRIPTIN